VHIFVVENKTDEAPTDAAAPAAPADEAKDETAKPADESNPKKDVKPTEKASEAPGDGDGNVAAVDGMSSHSSDDYASVQDASTLGGHLGSLPVGDAPPPTAPIRDMKAAGVPDAHSHVQPFPAEISSIQSPSDLHTKLHRDDAGAMHCDMVQALITVTLPRPSPKGEADHGEDAAIRTVLFKLGRCGLELPTLPAEIKGIDTGSSSMLHSVRENGSSFNDIGVEPASLHVASEDPESLLAVIGYDDTDKAMDSDSKGILVISGGMDYALLESILDHVRPGVPSRFHFLPNTALPMSH
jgi:hypothetical protein